MRIASMVIGIAAAFIALPASAQSVVLTAADGTSTPMSAADLAALPRETVSLTIHDQTHVYSGPLLATVLARVSAPLGQALRGPALRSYVVVRAADGYAVLLSLAEVDPALRPGKIILADTADGAPLPPEDGPLRLIVEGDARPARSARQVVSIDLKRAD